MAANAALWLGACAWLAVIGLSRPYAFVLNAAGGGLLSAASRFAIAVMSLPLFIGAECTGRVGSDKDKPPELEVSEGLYVSVPESTRPD